MLVNVPYFLFALLLLWFPRQWMRLGFLVGGRRGKRHGQGKEPWKTHEAGAMKVSLRSEFAKVRNYVDFLRGGAGSLALLGGLDIVPSLGVAENAGGSVVLVALAVKLGILLVGLIMQTLRFEKRRFLYFAPIFYICGISIGLCGLKGALFAFVMMWTVNAMIMGPQGFLSVYALLILVFGQLFGGVGNKLTIVAALYCFLPVLLSLLSQRPLVLFTRKGVRPQGA